MLPELGAVDRLLRTVDPAGTMVEVAADSPEEVARIWEEWWEALETFRLYASEPQAWTTHFNTGLKSVLSPRERMALPEGWKSWCGRREMLPSCVWAQPTGQEAYTGPWT